jgi:thiol:disulfide interchange protein
MKNRFLHAHPSHSLLLAGVLGVATIVPLGCALQGSSTASAGAESTRLSQEPASQNADSPRSADHKGATASHPVKLSAIRWESSFEAAQEKARVSKKPIMVDFYTDWCGWCKELDAKTYTAEEVIDESQHFVSVKVNAEKRTDLAQRYKVDGFPTILWVDSGGAELDRLPGYAESKEFAQFMRSVHSKFATPV